MLLTRLITIRFPIYLPLLHFSINNVCPIIFAKTDLESSCRITKQDSTPSVAASSPPPSSPQTTISAATSKKLKLIQRDLFGGAIQINIPAVWRDVSAVRQVPDHQEVFQDCTSAATTTAASTTTNPVNAAKNDGDDNFDQKKVDSEDEDSVGTDGFIVVEILERQDHVSDTDAAKFFFDDLAESNDSKNTSIEYGRIWPKQKEGKTDGGCNAAAHLVPKLKTHATACSCIGMQSMDTVGRDKRRVELGGSSSKGSNENRHGDNDGINEKSSKIRVELCAVRLEEVQTDLLVTVTMPMRQGVTQKQWCVEGHSALFREVMSGFVVKDWSLFC